MTAQQLKNSILQMAVQGKLVPQDRNDEPASVLLERIRAEKEKLIREGKIKKEKNPSVIFRGEDNLPYEKIGNNPPVCIVEEAPFEIPASWAWARLSNICTIVNGFTPLRSNEQFWHNGTIPWFTVDDIHSQGRRIKHTAQQITELAIRKDSNRILPSNTVLICCTASIGEYAITEIPLTTNQQFNGLVIKEYWKSYYSPEYLLLLVQTFKHRLISVAGKTTFNYVSTKKLGDLIVPVLPYREQVLIVQKYNSTLQPQEEYDKLENALVKTDKIFPDNLKKSILQQAVMGKLVPQDETDEPASVLLDRIRAEKQALIKTGKLKKDKHESVIYRRDNSHYEKLDGVERCIDEEIPFEIPESWAWCRLQTVCTKLVDGNHNPPRGEDYTTPYIMASSTNINNDTLVELDRVRYLTEDLFIKENERTRATKGDIFFTSVGSLGRSCIFDGSVNICFQRSVSVLATLLNNQYLKYCFDSGYFQHKIVQEATGTAQKGFYLNQLSSALIPIPPMNEQYRIVERLKTALTSLSNL